MDIHTQTYTYTHTHSHSQTTKTFLYCLVRSLLSLMATFFVKWQRIDTTTTTTAATTTAVDASHSLSVLDTFVHVFLLYLSQSDSQFAFFFLLLPLTHRFFCIPYGNPFLLCVCLFYFSGFVPWEERDTCTAKSRMTCHPHIVFLFIMFDTPFDFFGFLEIQYDVYFFYIDKFFFIGFVSF